MTYPNDLSRTAAAIERRDRFVPLVWAAIDRVIDRHSLSGRECSARCDRLVALAERIERSVGVAFGLDTARPHGPNDPQVCADLVRAGEPTPPLGCSDVSFVRRCVRAWRASTMLDTMPRDAPGVSVGEPSALVWSTTDHDPEHP